MPIYEYPCPDCGRKTTVLTLRVSEQVEPKCERCGSGRLTRLMSRFALVRSEDDRLDDLGDPSSLGDLDENDPKTMARWMRKMGKELGEDAGDDFDEIDRKSTRLNSSHQIISYAVFCLKKKKKK